MTDGKEGGEDTGTVTFTDVPLATNDVQSMEEDSGTTTGNVLTNDVSGLKVTGIQIGGADYTVGTPFDIPNVGRMQINANGYQGNRTTKPLKSKNRLNCEQKGEPSCSPIRLTI